MTKGFTLPQRLEKASRSKAEPGTATDDDSIKQRHADRAGTRGEQPDQGTPA